MNSFGSDEHNRYRMSKAFVQGCPALMPRHFAVILTGPISKVTTEMSTRTMLGAALAATCVLQTAHADADPGTDFLAARNRYGIDFSALMGQPISRQDAIDLGQGYLQRPTPRDICECRSQ
jgi:hypothetical protein